MSSLASGSAMGDILLGNAQGCDSDEFGRFYKQLVPQLPRWKLAAPDPAADGFLRALTASCHLAHRQ